MTIDINHPCVDYRTGPARVWLSHGAPTLGELLPARIVRPSTSLSAISTAHENQPFAYGTEQHLYLPEQERQVNSIILNGHMTAAPQISVTKNGARKALFQLKTDGKDMPLHFKCVAFGVPADTASELFAGDEVLAAGRLTANVATRGITLVVHALELLHEAEPEGEAQAQPQ